jgi:hypothetical protein
MDLRELRRTYALEDQRPLLVTEVTLMTGHVCVATLDIHSGEIVRPLNPNGANWATAKWYNSGIMRVGNVLAVTMGRSGGAAPPHATEDRRLRDRVSVVGQLREHELYDICAETADASVSRIYGRNLVDGKYVPEGTDCRSLGCVMVDPDELHPHISFDSLRVRFRDGRGAYFDPAITQMDIREVGRAPAQLEALRRKLGTYTPGEPVALRLGLTRPWAGRDGEFNPKRCTMQLNGIIGTA